MSRTFPVIVLTLATLVGGAVGVGSSAAIRAVVATPEGATGAKPTGGADGGRDVAPPAPKGPKSPSPKEYLTTILCRNLIDSSKVGECEIIDERTASAREAAAEAEAKTDLNVTLLGTLVSTPEAFSSALILEEGQDRPVGYSLRDRIGDAEIIAIEKKLVRLRRGDGREEVLRMDGEEEERPQRASAAPDNADGGDEVEQVGENEYVIDADVLDRYLNDLESLAGMGRALLHRGPDGQFDGYRLSAIRRNTIADKLGIRNGDIIHNVNGKALNSMTSAMEAYQTMQNEKSFSFEITRRGQKMQMNYSVR